MLPSTSLLADKYTYMPQPRFKNHWLDGCKRANGTRSEESKLANPVCVEFKFGKYMALELGVKILFSQKEELSTLCVSIFSRHQSKGTKYIQSNGN